MGMQPYGFDPSKIKKQAMDLQKQMGKVQDQLKEMVVEGTSGGGMVKAFANGQQEVVGIKIDPEVVNKDDVAMLEDLVAAAVSQALKKAKDLQQAEMAKLTGGLALPGMF
jgi:DNA-binding YbaB/EbfC family protein